MRNHFSLLDNVIMKFDQSLRTVFATPNESDRKNPADSIEEPVLSSTNKSHIAGLMRVNHAGEVSAQALYQGQALTARDRHVHDSMQQAAAEENDHLLWCEKRISELGDHTSYLNPLWYCGSFCIGALAGLAGDKWSLGFVIETEKQVIQHLEKHLAQMRVDPKTTAILQQMKDDESHHATMAQHAGGEELPNSVKSLMRFMSSVMTTTAYYA